MIVLYSCNDFKLYRFNVLIVRVFSGRDKLGRRDVGFFLPTDSRSLKRILSVVVDLFMRTIRTLYR